MPCELTNLKFLNSPAISDSEEDYDNEKDNLEKGVDEADDENGTKGENQDDFVYIFKCCFSLSLIIYPLLKL